MIFYESGWDGVSEFNGLVSERGVTGIAEEVALVSLMVLAIKS